MNRTQPRKRGLRTAGPLGLIVLVVVAGLTWIGVTGGENDSPTTGTAQSASSTAPPIQPTPPLTPSSPELQKPTVQLNTLAVKGRAPKTGYKRTEFGQAWTDDDGVMWGGNSLSTREDILSRDLTEVSCKIRASGPSRPPCVVHSGVLADPYTGTTVEFVKGKKTSALVPIDDIVSLSDSWQKGAQRLSPIERINFANDPLNLIATTAATNSAKSDSDAATWLVPHKAFRCTYVARQIAVKTRYRLWVTLAEKQVMATVLARCPGATAAHLQ